MSKVTQEVRDLIFHPEEVKALTIEHLERLRAGKGTRGVPTGLPSIDKYLNPLVPGQLMVVLGRPSNGKTALMAHYIREAALRREAEGIYETAPPIFVTAEMAVEEIQLRELSHAIPLDSIKLYRGQIADWDEVFAAVEQVYEESPVIYLGHSIHSKGRRPRMSMQNIEKAILMIRDEYDAPPEIVALDYAQRLRLDGKARDRRLEVAEIVERTKDLANLLPAPVLLGSQAGRQVEDRMPPIPDARDAKESGNLEETADVVVSVMRPSKYFEINEVIPKTDGLLCSEQLFFIKVIKQRMGEAGKGFWVYFDMALSMLADLEVDRYDLNADEVERYNVTEEGYSN